MSQAVVGLIGVVVGATVTGVFHYIVRRRADSLDARAAARLVHEALISASVPTLDSPRLPEVYDFQWFVDEWREHRGVLAWALTNEEWGGFTKLFRWRNRSPERGLEESTPMGRARKRSGGRSLRWKRGCWVCSIAICFVPSTRPRALPLAVGITGEPGSRQEIGPDR
jgi:hypothetical protein